MLSQAVGYAAAALGCLAGSDRRQMLVREMSEEVNVPGPYLSKILHQLGRRGLVVTQRGIGGGVMLARPATEITLFDLCVALGDPIVDVRCFLGTAECSDLRACPAHRFWTTEREHQLAFLKNTTLQDMSEFERRRHLAATGSPAFEG